MIADIFDKRDIEKTENLFKELFIVDKKEVLTINVKHAMKLDKPRIERLVQSISENKYVRRIMCNFLALAEESKTYMELGKTKDYICYVLRPISRNANNNTENQ